MKPIGIGLLTNTHLQQELANRLPDYTFHWGLELKGAVIKASDIRPALIIIDLDDGATNWQAVTIALRTSPATRRIPLIGLCQQFTDELQKQIQAVHFEAIIRQGELDQIAAVAATHARVWDEKYYAALQTMCEEPLPENAVKGLALFNAGEFWEAHEALEHAWVAEPRQIRELYRAILQIGVAYHQIQRGNYRGALKIFLRAVQWLDPLPDRCQGIDIAQFKQDAAAARAELERLTPETISTFDQALLKPVPMVLPK